MAKSHIRGLDRWTRWVSSLPEEVAQEVKGVVAEHAYKIEADAKRLVPVDTGHLRRSIATAFKNGGLTAYIGTNVEYALYVEFGTSKQHAQPFLTPAFVKWKDKFDNELLKAVSKAGE
ncbi:HK97 gp10 family phage protein [Neobacillus sedimentimangrovi]|uniref:HK97 gp10 family phage protein n=1 Tax=Neobacillus sedimentimangrovi TaxID=2699460 RepID=A0ABS8QKB8_9BACI|nr:HK97-gp10 family putative phage morphogenesis protein [Neobacillus sedimentimangrovi]MCD4839732.1 HK97 gp10 family phage protein [Neobacillus sedimentimangrovi]